MTNDGKGFTLEELVQSIISAYETGKNTNVPVTLLQTSSADTEQAKPSAILDEKDTAFGKFHFTALQIENTFLDQEGLAAVAGGLEIYEQVLKNRHPDYRLVNIITPLLIGGLIREYHARYIRSGDGLCKVNLRALADIAGFLEQKNLYFLCLTQCIRDKPSVWGEEQTGWCLFFYHKHFDDPLGTPRFILGTNLADVACQLGYKKFTETATAIPPVKQQQEQAIQGEPIIEAFDKHSVAMQDIYNPKEALEVFRLHAIPFSGSDRPNPSVHNVHVLANPDFLLVDGNYKIDKLILFEQAVALLECATTNTTAASRLLTTALCVIATLVDNAGLVFYSLERCHDGNNRDFWLFRYYHGSEYSNAKYTEPHVLQNFSLVSLLRGLLTWNEAVRLRNNLHHSNKQKD